MTAPDHEPLSWLTLERYALGELSARERADVEQRLARSPDDRACLASILEDQTVLLPLPIPLHSGVRALPARWWRRPPLVGGMLAAAAALLVVLGQRGGAPPSRRMAYDGTKGGEVALIVHSARQGRAPKVFAGDDRFKLEVSCPDWLSGRLHVLVFQGGERFRPLPDAGELRCGNGVPWPGAFALDGHEPADVCVTWDVDGDRRASATRPEDLSPNVVCTRLEPR